jgi:hypothetical protein
VALMLGELRQTVTVKPGGVIEVQSADLPVGSTVEVIVLVNRHTFSAPISHPLRGLTREERIAKIRAAVGGWQADDEMVEIFAAIDQSRHTDQGRAIATFDDE